MNTTANANAMTAILQADFLGLEPHHQLRAVITSTIFFAYAPGVTCLMAATGPLSTALREPSSAGRPPAS